MAALLLFTASYAQQTSRLLIHFDFDKYTIRPPDAAALGKMLHKGVLPSVKSIELYGHCDSIGDHAYNDALSAKRVASTREYLVSQGIDEKLFVKTEGYGKRQPLNENSSPEQRLDNRRVELVVTWNENNPVVMPDPEKDKPAQKASTPSLTEIIKDSATKTGNTIILRNLQFIPGRHYLLPESQPIVEELYQVMADNPTLVIQIQGHVCCTPDNEDGYDYDLRTMNLSVQRARAIFDYLIERKIEPSRLSFKGFGGSKKLYPLEQNDFERQENRRVELKIISR